MHLTLPPRKAQMMMLPNLFLSGQTGQSRDNVPNVSTDKT
jgi:hypothetical protein